MSERRVVEQPQVVRVDVAGVVWLAALTLAVALFIAYVAVWS